MNDKQVSDGSTTDRAHLFKSESIVEEKPKQVTHSQNVVAQIAQNEDEAEIDSLRTVVVALSQKLRAKEEAAWELEDERVLAKANEEIR